MPSTNTLEKRVVFGGENHLRELTKTTWGSLMLMSILYGLISDDIRQLSMIFQAVKSLDICRNSRI
ncbi:hypothetical protein [Methanosarcina sp. UBA5]|uniref:hypothetical protein n=1 Tax=Methanosarcina sp. UBA5 TaxID=1915593 RepID=UPI0025CF416F|nr:hypothetical protein [Methanosarcina sp. UBA5]